MSDLTPEWQAMAKLVSQFYAKADAGEFHSWEYKSCRCVYGLRRAFSVLSAMVCYLQLLPLSAGH